MISAEQLLAKWSQRQADWSRLGALVSGEAVAREIVADVEQLGAIESALVAPVADAPESASWQERIWTAPADTRLTVADVAEALSRPKSFVYRHTSPATGLPRIPHRKLDGELVFLAGEVRGWIRDREDVVVKPASVVPIHRARRAQSAHETAHEA